MLSVTIFRMVPREPKTPESQVPSKRLEKQKGRRRKVAKRGWGSFNEPQSYSSPDTMSVLIVSVTVRAIPSVSVIIIVFNIAHVPTLP